MAAAALAFTMKWRFAAAALALLLALPGAPALAFSDTRAQEIAQCLPGELQTWNDGRDTPSPHGAWLFFYAHAGAPDWFSAAQVQAVLQRAAQAWAPCGLPVQVMDDAQARTHKPDPAQGRVRVQWDDAAVRGNFAAANLTQRTLNLSPAMFALLRQRNPRHPAIETLQMTVSHEMGHFLGLVAHSRRCVDVMSYYDDGKGKRCSLRDPAALKAHVEYRSQLPTACDIQRCRAANGLR
ncbi:MAG: hypothetical protein C0423_16195 [Methylibium sp.]|nr:hypothetical protein [Methylibium sp.]